MSTQTDATQALPASAGSAKARALVVTLKHRAEAYLRDWDEARAKQSPNAPASSTPNQDDNYEPC